jgi:hypothetical protein
MISAIHFTQLAYANVLVFRLIHIRVEGQARSRARYHVTGHIRLEFLVFIFHSLALRTCLLIVITRFAC